MTADDSSPLNPLQAQDDYDIFISYSRKDSEFVSRLWAAFRQAGKKPWLDRDNIPLTAKWREEISEGIEKAGNFVFIISPDSVTSAACREEIEYAVKLNKRLVPVMHRYTSAKTVQESLAEIQFIALSPSDDFQTAFKEHYSPRF